MSHIPPPLIESFAGVRAGFLNLPDGAKLRYAMFDPPSKPHDTVLITPGRREFIEKKYAEMGSELLARGFRLIFVEWRGQGLSTRHFDGEKYQRDHAVDFTMHLDDLNHFYDVVVAPQLIGKLIIHGHSMGAHILTRWLTERANHHVAGAFLTAPMLALAGGMAHASANFLSWTTSKLGYGGDYAPMQADYGVDDLSFAGNPLTHDPERFTIIEKYFSAYPELKVGGVTWDWLQAALKSMYQVQRRFRLEHLDVPMLAMVGNEDRVTPPDEIMRYLRMIPKAESIIIPGSRHDLMNEIAPIRDECWRQIDGFLQKVL